MTPASPSNDGVLARVQWGATTIETVFIPRGALPPTLVREVDAGQVPGLSVQRVAADAPSKVGRWGGFDGRAIAGPLVVLMCFASALFAIALESADRYLGPGNDASREGAGDGERRPVGYFSRPARRAGKPNAPPNDVGEPRPRRSAPPTQLSADLPTAQANPKQAARELVGKLFGHDVFVADGSLSSELRKAMGDLVAVGPATRTPGLMIDGGRGSSPGQLASLEVSPAGGGRGRGITDGSAGIGLRGAGSGAYGSGMGLLSGKRDVDIGLSMVEPNIIGVLDPALIRAVVRRNASQVRYCYELALSRRPALEGRVKVKWVIDASGAVATSAIDESDVGDVELETCLVSRVRTWTFPRPVGGGVVVVHYPFVLKANP